MNYPENLKYTQDHEWVDRKSDGVYVGITDHAQSELGDVVFIELPQVGDKFEQGQGFAVIESVKAVSDVYTPITGTVTKINEAIADVPESLNNAPYDAWIAVFDTEDDLTGLMSAKEYTDFLGE